MAQLTKEEQDQKLLDIAFEPDCNCTVVNDEHETFCAWRRWRDRMNRYEEEG